MRTSIFIKTSLRLDKVKRKSYCIAIRYILPLGLRAQADGLLLRHLPDNQGRDYLARPSFLIWTLKPA